MKIKHVEKWEPPTLPPELSGDFPEPVGPLAARSRALREQMEGVRRAFTEPDVYRTRILGEFPTDLPKGKIYFNGKYVGEGSISTQPDADDKHAGGPVGPMKIDWMNRDGEYVAPPTPKPRMVILGKDGITRDVDTGAVVGSGVPLWPHDRYAGYHPSPNEARVYADRLTWGLIYLTPGCR